MPLQLVKELPVHEKDSKTCLFCNRSEDNELQYGKFYSNECVTAHYYCLLFSSGLEQKGKDDEGILGFLKQDMLKESKRGSKLTCSKCRHSGATVGCCNKICKKTYHFPCGVESQMLNQYFGAFNSYCIKHQPVQNVVVKGSGQKATCTICHEEVTAQPSFDILWAPCCKKQSWFHRICMQKLALSAGYFFKCPMCSNNSLFCNEMKRCGIYIPDQDASWELEPNAFQELVQRHNVCDCPVCVCPKGRKYDGEGTRWELLLCASCGSKGIHIGCGKLDWSTMEWDCDDCSSLASKHKRASLEPGPSNSLACIPGSADSSGSHSAVKRLRSSELTINNGGSDDNSVKRIRSNETGSEDSDDSDIDILSVIDPKSPVQLPSHSSVVVGASNFQPSRNVARRGRGGWASRPADSRGTVRRKPPACNFENLRFKVTDDSKNIIVIIDDDQAKTRSFTIPVDQPVSPKHRRIHHASNRK